MGKTPRGLVPNFVIMEDPEFLAGGDAGNNVRREVGRCGSVILIDAEL